MYQTVLILVLYFLVVSYFVISEAPISEAVDMKSELFVFKLITFVSLYSIL